MFFQRSPQKEKKRSYNVALISSQSKKKMFPSPQLLLIIGKTKLKTWNDHREDKSESVHVT